MLAQVRRLQARLRHLSEDEYELRVRTLAEDPMTGHLDDAATEVQLELERLREERERARVAEEIAREARAIE